MRSPLKTRKEKPRRARAAGAPVRHPVKWFSRVLVLRWAWRNRYDLARWGRFVMRLPAEVRTRDLDDLVTEARARITLSADPRTRSSKDLDITGYENGALIVRAPAEQPVAQVAHDLLSAVSGVSDVRIVDDRLPAADDTVVTPSPAPGSRPNNQVQPVS